MLESKCHTTKIKKIVSDISRGFSFEKSSFSRSQTKLGYFPLTKHLFLKNSDIVGDFL
jgi:hypothetical protein